MIWQGDSVWIASRPSIARPVGTALANCRRMPATRTAFSPSSSHPSDTVPLMRHLLWRIALALVAPSLLSACAGDDCSYGEVQCDGNSARTCVSGERTSYWQTEDCGSKTCVVAANTASTTAAFCAVSVNPDPRCAEADVPNCAGNTLVECTAGYATSTRSCATGCLSLDDYPDRCVEDVPLERQDCNTTQDGDLCTMEGGGMQLAEGPSSPMPTGVCSEGPELPGQVSVPPLPAPSVYAIYSQRCEGGSVVARTRCAQSCGQLADCSTTCM